MAKLRVTWCRSSIGQKKEHSRTIRALGLKRLHQQVEREDTPAIRGMLHHVRHLVRVEDVEK